ncbi:MAG TPA: chemotaxis protein CheW [Candidatus Acidoferrum sp.]|nr:chemotaxis protein CheW [Candidatus Acidoferrum sp.]
MTLPRFDHSVCVFWVGAQCFGLQSSLVGEVFVVEARVSVPVAPPSVVGLFNLRGLPVALVDIAQLLELPDGAAAADEPVDRAVVALVLRTGELTVGLRIRKMELVLPAGQGLYHPIDQGAGEHPAVAGFLELPARPDLTVTLLDPAQLLSGLRRLRYREIEGDEGE